MQPESLASVRLLGRSQIESGTCLGWSKRGRWIRLIHCIPNRRCPSLRAHCGVSQDLRTVAEVPSCRYCTNQLLTAYEALMCSGIMSRLFCFSDELITLSTFGEHFIEETALFRISAGVCVSVLSDSGRVYKGLCSFTRVFNTYKSAFQRIQISVLNTAQSMLQLAKNLNGQHGKYRPSPGLCSLGSCYQSYQ